LRASAAALRLRCLVLDDPRAVALGNEPVRIGLRSPAASRAVASATRSARRSPTHPCRPTSSGARVEVDVFGTWVGAEIKAGALVDPRANAFVLAA
jgi:4-methylaminobutanoate oxidase (formaldehyde-forming)